MEEITSRPRAALRVGFVPGVMPGKWEKAWADRKAGRRLELRLVEVANQETLVRNGDLDMCLVRGEIDRDGMHLIPLYREVPVVVVGLEHPVSAFEEIALADLADEFDVPAEFPELTLAQVVETVAAGTGIAVMPMSLARLHQRKDTAYRPVTDGEESPIGLAWLIDHPDPDVQTFIGIVRGRSVNSSR